MLFPKILFGSCSVGEDTKRSDIDIIVEAKEKEINTEKFEKKDRIENGIVTKTTPKHKRSRALLKNALLQTEF